MSSFVRVGRGATGTGGDYSTTSPTSSLSTIPKGCVTSSGDTLQTGSGVPSLDTMLGGGGLHLGSILVVREDWPRSTANYANSLLKCIMAEGLQLGHYLLVVDGGGMEVESNLLGSLPLPASQASGREAESELPLRTGEGDEKMTIAWRYKHLRKLDDDESTPAGSIPGGISRLETRSYDLGRRMPEETMKTTYEQMIKYINLMEQLDVADGLQDLIVSSALELIAKTQTIKSVVRIILRTFPTPLLGDPQDHQETLFPRILHCLRRALAPYADRYLIVISSPSPRLFPPLPGVEDQADAIIELQSFVGTPRENVRALSEYSGFLRIIKPLRKVGTLALHLPVSSDLAFKVRRRQLIFEPFHMPPDLEEENQGSPVKKGAGPSCPSTGLAPSKLDF